VDGLEARARVGGSRAGQSRSFIRAKLGDGRGASSSDHVPTAMRDLRHALGGRARTDLRQGLVGLDGVVDLDGQRHSYDDRRQCHGHGRDHPYEPDESARGAADRAIRGLRSSSTNRPCRRFLEELPRSIPRPTDRAHVPMSTRLNGPLALLFMPSTKLTENSANPASRLPDPRRQRTRCQRS